MAKTKDNSSQRRHLLTINCLSDKDIEELFSTAEKYLVTNRKTDKKLGNLKGRTLINLFFENSTRTKTSFELAGKRLGIDTINIQTSSSALKKGETILDTVATLDAMNPDFIVVRHNESGAAKLIAEHANCSVINAGDGCHEHPTQALLDAMTIKNRLKKIEGLNIAICGDILHSRVARSNIKLLNRLGAKVRLIAPPTLLPPHVEVLNADSYTDINEGLKDVDVVMVLRLQMERMSGCFIPSVREYYHLYGIDYKKLAIANDNVLVLHPGPINRGVEIESSLADDLEKNAILDQVEAGVAMRQAVLELLA